MLMLSSSSLSPPSSPLFTVSSTSNNHSAHHHHSPLSLLPQCRTIAHLKEIHAHLFRTGLHASHLALSKLVEFCALSPGDPSFLHHALLVFDSIPDPNHFLWNTIIRGYSIRDPTPDTPAVRFFVRMLLAGVLPNSYTFPFLLKACASASALEEGKQAHAFALKLGLAADPFVHTSLIDMYARAGELPDARHVFDAGPANRDAVPFTALINGYVLCGRLDDARRLFDEIPVRDVVSWNAMISGYAQGGRSGEALHLFREMLRSEARPNDSTMVSALSACAQSGSVELGKWVHSWIEERGLDSNLRLVNALVDMYAKCGCLELARALFDGIRRKDQVSWNVMIGGYTHASRYKEALQVFRLMQMSKVEPNAVTFLSILPACAYLGALDIGKWIHMYVKRSISSDSGRNSLASDSTTIASLRTSLIDMYSKCGSIESARLVFDAMEKKSLSSWNAMISGLAMHSCAEKAFCLFTAMIEEGIEPDEITFVGILSACSHAGLVETGRQYYNSMICEYRIPPKVQHYGCMVDLFGRAGLLHEAENLIKKMEVEPDGAIWGSLLGACRVHGNVELAECAAKHLIEIEPENAGVYVLLSNIYAAAGKWDDVARIRTELNDHRMKKLPGCSSIEVDSIVHEFLVGDQSHPQCKEIYKMLDEMERKLELAGYVPDTSEVLYDVEEEWKEGILCHHSEKLAIAFGLISTTAGTTIRIVKNLRVCGNCHSASKLISKIYNRVIIARDRNRFHHFKDGICSCNDYW